MAVTVQATFKKDKKDFDGLGAISGDLVAEPLTRRVIVAVVEVTEIVLDVLDGGTQTPKVRLVNVEALAGDDALTARKLLDAAYHERTGQTAPPPTLFDEGTPGQDAAASGDGEPPWDESEGDDTGGASTMTATEAESKRGKRK